MKTCYCCERIATDVFLVNSYNGEIGACQIHGDALDPNETTWLQPIAD